MKLTIAQPQLLGAAAFVSRVCPARPTVPITAGVLLTATDGALRIQAAADGAVWAEATTAAQVTAAGRVAVPGRLLAAVANAAPPHAQVELVAADTTVQVRIDGGSWTLPALPAQDYPPRPAPGPPLGQVAGAALAAALAHTAPVASTDPDLPFLHAVRLRAGDQHLSLAATDRYQLALRDLAWTPAPDAPAGTDRYLPLPAAAHLADLAQVADTVVLAATDTTLSLTGAGQALTCRLAAGRMPPRRRGPALPTVRHPTRPTRPCARS